MSDSHIYELQDIVWDDFSISDDHLVPYPQVQLQQSEGKTVHTETHKKLKHEDEVVNGAVYGGVASEKTIFSYPKIESDEVLADGSSSHNPDACQTYSALMANLSSDGVSDTKGNSMSNNNLYVGASYPISNCTAADNNIFSSMSDTHHSESELSFLSNSHENKDIDDSLFYDWPEIGNYDLNQMLSSCDFASGLGDLGIEDDMCWFSSSKAINSHCAASQLEVGSSYSDSNSVKIFSGNCESPQPTYESPTVDALKKENAGARHILINLPSNTIVQSCLSKASSINKLPTDSNKMIRKKSLKEVNMYTRNMDNQTQSLATNTSLCPLETPKLTAEMRFFSKMPPKLSLSNCSGPEKQNESLNKNFQSDERLLEETSFLQLQEVMEQMDLKTKLCIRDSLYRLARSAEQRHGIATVEHSDHTDKNYNEASIAGTKQAGLSGTEADTNPMDRTIAHLLFHRPNDSPKMHSSNTRPCHYLNNGDVNFHVSKPE